MLWSCRLASVSSGKPPPATAAAVNTDRTRHHLPDTVVKRALISPLANAMPTRNARPDPLDHPVHLVTPVWMVSPAKTVILASMPRTAKWLNRRACVLNAHQVHLVQRDPQDHQEPKA